MSFNKSRISFTPRDLAVPTEINNLTVQWYLSVNVTNSTNNNPVSGAEVVINNSIAVNVFTGNTDANGGIPTQIVTEFTLNGSANSSQLFASDSCVGVNNLNVTCFSPFNITVNLTGYNRNFASVSVNRSTFVNVSLVINAIPPVINTNYTFPAYPMFNQNTTFVINVTGTAGSSIVYVNFTLVAPNGTKVINNTNSTKGTGDL